MAIQAAGELESQYRVLREGAGLLDQRDRAKLDVTGPDAAEFLQGQVTNDVLALEPGQGCYALLLNPKGRVLADMRVLRRGDEELWLDSEPDVRESLLGKLQMYTVGRAVEVVERTDERALLSVIGPRSYELAGIDATGSEYSQAVAEIGGVECVAAETDVGLDLFCARDAFETVRSSLADAGAVPIDEQAVEIVRIERGHPRLGVDMTDDNLPGELGLEDRAISYTKGCYVGQEPVARMHYRGHPNRHLRGLELSGPVSAGAALTADGREVGRLTSSAVSPTFGAIALATVRREVEPGDEAQVGDGIRARVVELPFGG